MALPSTSFYNSVFSALWKLDSWKSYRFQQAVCSRWRTCPRTILLFWASACCSAPKRRDCHLACFMPHLVIYLAALLYSLHSRLWTLENSRVCNDEAKSLGLCTVVAGVKADCTVTGILGSTEETGKSPRAHGDIFVAARLQISLALLNLEISQEIRASPSLLLSLGPEVSCG